MTDHFLANAGLMVFQPVSVLPSNKLVDGLRCLGTADLGWTVLGRGW